MTQFTQEQVGVALKRLGNYRVKRCQEVANSGQPDGIAGKHLLALGMGETLLQNILGGLKWVASPSGTQTRLGEKGNWVALNPNDPAEAKLMDVGVFQISRRYHSATLARMPGVAAGTWGPVISGRADIANYVPRFEDSLQFTITGLHEAAAYGEDMGVPENILPRFAVAAHNAGWGGALKGWREGDVDKYTALGDYSKSVWETAKLVDRWLYDHPNWRVWPGQTVTA
jgi:hypothetical protein